MTRMSNNVPSALPISFNTFSVMYTLLKIKNVQADGKLINEIMIKVQPVLN